MPNQKGFIGLEEIIAATVVIIAVLVALMFVTKSKSGIEGSVEEFCKNNPISPICGGKSTTLITGVAAWSTEALACAINSVSTGTADSCLVKFSPEGSGLTSLAIAKSDPLSSAKKNIQYPRDLYSENLLAQNSGISGKSISGFETGTSGVQSITKKSGTKKEGSEEEEKKSFEPATVECLTTSEIEYIDSDNKIGGGDKSRSLKVWFNGNNWEYSIGSYYADKKWSESSPADNPPKEWPHGYGNFDEKKNHFLQIIHSLKGDTEQLGLEYLVNLVNTQRGDYLIVYQPNSGWHPSGERKGEDFETPININKFLEKTKRENQIIGECKVKNFNLPQSFNEYTVPLVGVEFTPEEWIAGLGDPMYKVWWQEFPQEEASSWQGFSTWMGNVFTFAMFALPVGSAVGYAGKKIIIEPLKAIGSKIFPSASRAFEKIAEKILGRLPSTAGTAAAKEGLEVMAQTAGKEVVTTASGTSVKFVWPDKQARIGKIIETFSKSTWFNTISKNFEKGKLWTALKFLGFTGSVAYTAALLDSLFEGSKPHPNSIALKTPGLFDWGETMEYPLTQTGNNDGMPVVLWKNGAFSFAETQPTFYLASPCDADVTVTKGKVYCGKYSYDKKTGTTRCTPIDDMEKTTESEKVDDMCTNPKMLDKPDMQGITSMLKGSDRRLFEFGENMDQTKIFIPSIKTDDVYFTNLQDAGGTKVPFDPRALIKRASSAIKGVYKADIYVSGETKGSVDVLCQTSGRANVDPFINSEGTEVFACEFENSQLPKISVGQDEETITKVEIIGSTQTDKFYMEKINTKSGDIIAFNDIDGDGNWDEIGIKTQDSKAFNNFAAIDSDGNANTFTSSNCNTPAIVVSPVIYKYRVEDQEGKNLPSFCHSKTSTRGKLVITAALLTDAVLLWYSAGTGWQIAAGILWGATYVASGKMNEWPY